MHCLALHSQSISLFSFSVSAFVVMLQVIDWVGGETWGGCLIFDGMQLVSVYFYLLCTFST